MPWARVAATVAARLAIISNTTLGLRSVNPDIVNLFRLNNASRWQPLARLRSPNALPYFFRVARIAKKGAR